MSVKKLHTNSKIFFSNPYMVRVEFPVEVLATDAEKLYRKIIRSAYKLIGGTWGYCPLEYETWRTADAPVLPPFAQQTSAQQLTSLFDNSYVNTLRGYVCFADEMDALQFRLTIDTSARQVYMWPKREFTIHEVAETDA